MRLPAGALLSVAFACSCSGGSSHASSTFDNDDEGWMLTEDATTTRPELRASGGNPGGHICGTDGMRGATWYFIAPENFLHDASKSYGKRLTWALKQDSIYQQLKGRDVVLQGNGLGVVFDIRATPGLDWTPYQVRLDGSSGWKRDEPPDNPPATDDDLRTLLRNVTELRIRGEFKDGPDHECLDNVYFGVE